MSLASLQPSQLYISAEKLAFVQRTFRPITVWTLPPIPMVELDGQVVSTGGLGVADRGDRILGYGRARLGAYRICVGWCLEEGVRCPADLTNRVVGREVYRTLWLDRCRAMQRALAERRRRR